MNKYELALVVNAKIEDEARAEVVEKAKGYITRFGGTISSDDAVAIVLQKLPEAKESDVRVRLDTDDGRTVYEGSVYLSGSRQEYEFEIDASTGEIISWEED